jgi:putative ABC transport system permease protein
VSLVHRLGAGWQVTDLGTTTARLANSITSVDLSGRVSLDIAFAVLIAIGAEPRQVRASLIGETLFVGVAGIATGLLTGGLVGVALLQILAGVFDPPADLPAIPLIFIGAMTGSIVVALFAALAVADRGLSRLSVVAALRER